MSDHREDRPTVLHIFSGDLWAGAEVMIFNLIRRFTADPSLKLIALSLNEGILSTRLKDAGVETYVISEASHSFLKIVSNAVHLLKGRKIDIIHSHRYKENLLGLILAKAIGVNSLMASLHGLSEPLPHAQNGRSLISLKTKIDYYILNHFFTRLVAVSQEMKKVLVQKYGFRQEKLDVVYNGIPLPSHTQLSNHYGRDYYHIGTVGRMVPVKDFNLFLDVAADVMKQTDKVRFSILGDGEQKSELIQKAKDLKIINNVEFLAPRPDPLSYYLSLDLYLNTSLHEGIPLSILEVMACGKPVVAPKVGGIPEIISHEEDGLLVEGRSPREFAQSCLRVMRDGGFRASVVGKAFTRVSTKFSDDQMSQSYRRIYQELCQKC